VKNQFSSLRRDQSHSPIVIVVDPELLDFMPKYLANRRTDLQRFEQFLKNNDCLGIEKLSHKIRGHATSYGMPELSEICKNLEVAARMMAMPQIEILVAAYKDYLSRVELPTY